MKKFITSQKTSSVLELYEEILKNPNLKITGKTSVTKYKNNKIIEEDCKGENVITTRARFVLGYLLASNLKNWTAGMVPNSPWTSYFGENFINGVDPGSYAYPFADSGGGAPIGGITQELKSNNVFGGVQASTDNRWGGAAAVLGAAQNVSLAYHRGAASIEANLLYALGVTGMAFGNGGHLFDPSALVTSSIDSNNFCLDEWNAATSSDVSTKPAQPYDATNPGYSWPGGGIKENYPNLHQPDNFLYEEVLNGVVPWGYAGLATIADNRNGLPGTRAVYEGNTTLYSETTRIPLDKADGIKFENGNRVKFQVTIPADSELNQQRNYGYARRPRNWITEMGLITGDNITIQSPDVKTSGAIDPSVNGVSNVYGGQLVETGYVASGSWYTAMAALPKDYFTRLRDPETNSWFLDSDGQLDTNYNNTWNLIARKVFGVDTKNQHLAMTYIWEITFG